MGWQSPINTDYNLNFTLSATAISVNSSISANKLPSLYHINTNKTFNSNKTQLVKTRLRGLSTGLQVRLATGMSFSLSPGGFSDFLNVSGLSSSIPNGANTIYHFSKPSSSYTDDRWVQYRANRNFNQSSGLGIIDYQLYELDWQVNGYIMSDDGTNTFTSNTHGLGWKFIDTSTSSTGFIWYDATASINNNYPIGGNNNAKLSDADFRETNFITKFIPYQFFNLHFIYEKVSGNNPDGVKIYLSDDAPTITTNVASFNSWQNSPFTTLIGTVSQSVGVPINGDFYGLQGNKYVTFVASKSSSPTQSLLLTLTQLNIEGGYHDQNNELQSMTLPSYTTTIAGATYTAFVGNGNTINATQSLELDRIYSRIGNGEFKAGIWENGVWNNGYRDDENIREFDDADITFRILSDVKWRIRIIGASSSVSFFKIGDKVSIGNIVAVDINENRKLLKNSFTIVNLNETGVDERRGFIVVETDTTFPIRRIEKDSPNHRIKITKNVWLNGAFLNGYFTGIWNNGLVRGYPFITEFYETNWIDGIFDGGHFNSQLSVTASFVDTVWNSGKVGLTFSSPHKFIVGDIITINKDDKTINPQYDGETIVSEIPNDYSLITDLDWGQNSSGESGQITTKISTSLIQNFKFYDNNRSKITSASSFDSENIFLFDSWIDVNYDNTSAVNIGKPQTLINEVSNKSYSENNLFGYPTYEVLSSESLFRDSFSNTKRRYSLGTKFTEFSDFVGNSSRFEEYFGPTGSNLQLFMDQGWTFSSFGPSSITFSRTIGNENILVEGKELKVQAISEGGILDLSQPNLVIDNRDTSEIQKNRYTIVEFDLVTYSINELEYEEEQTNTAWGPTGVGKFTLGPGFKGANVFEPLIHFNNINVTTRSVNFPLGIYDIVYSSTYLPIYENVNHLTTPGRRKVEYFFNKRNLGMHFKGSGLYGASQSEFIIDNLTIKEVDMIPFFKYYQDVNINRAIQIPYQGIAPFIDYSDANFQFLDNISIGSDSFSIVSTNDVYSGVGPGIGSITSGTGVYTSTAEGTEFGITE